MKFYWSIPIGLRPHYQAELNAYQQYLAAEDLQKAWHHLERAHIIGQPWALEHSQVHWLMLRFGFKIKSWKEIRGQILRLLVGGVKSFVGKIPVGNTGGANVPPLQVLDLPADLEPLMQRYR